MNEKMDKLESSNGSANESGKRKSLANTLRKLDLSQLDMDANAQSDNKGFTFDKELESSDGLIKNKE